MRSSHNGKKRELPKEVYLDLILHIDISYGMKSRLAEELQASFNKAKLEGKAEVLAGMTYTALFGVAAAGVAYVGQDTTLGVTVRYFLSGMMFVCAKITDKDITRLGEILAAHRRDAESLDIRLK